MKKKIPTFKTDVEAGRFVATADLSKYDLSDQSEDFCGYGSCVNERVLIDAASGLAG